MAKPAEFLSSAPTLAVNRYVNDVDTLAAELHNRSVAIVSAPEDGPCGCRQIAVQDPDGHLIGFDQDMKPGAKRPSLYFFPQRRLFQII